MSTTIELDDTPGYLKVASRITAVGIQELSPDLKQFLADLADLYGDTHLSGTGLHDDTIALAIVVWKRITGRDSVRD